MVAPAIAASLISGGASLLGGIFSGHSARRQNRQSREEAERNRQFQERMSSTAHQREVSDLRAAGLNPILSATGGSGASSPSGNVAPISDTGASAVHTAMSLARLAADIKNIDATTERTNAQTVNELNKAVITGTTANAAGLVNTGLNTVGSLGQWLGENTAKTQLAVKNLLNSITPPTSGAKHLKIKINKRYTKQELNNMSPRKRNAILKARKSKNYKGK